MRVLSVLSAAAIAATVAAPAIAGEGKAIACYDKHWVPATYTTSKKLKSPERTEWVHRDGQVVKVYHAPTYIEQRHVAKQGHYVLRMAECK